MRKNKGEENFMEVFLRNPVVLVTLFNLNILLLKRHSREQRIIDYINIFIVEIIVCNFLLFCLRFINL